MMPQDRGDFRGFTTSSASSSHDVVRVMRNRPCGEDQAADGAETAVNAMRNDRKSSSPN